MDRGKLLMDIRRLLPDFQISESDLSNPLKPQFVVRFFEAIIADLNLKFASILDNKFKEERVEELLNGNPDFLLFKNVLNLLRPLAETFHMPIIYFYTPMPKVLTIITIVVHYLSFINNILDDLAELWDNFCTKYQHSIDLQQSKSKLLEDVEELSLSIGQAKETIEHLNKAVEDLEAENAKIAEVKNKKTEDRRKLLNEIKEIQDNIQRSKEMEKMLKEKEERMMQQIVNEEEYNRLLQTEEKLVENKTSSSELIENLDLQNKIKKNKANKLEDFNDQLNNVNFDENLTSNLQAQKRENKILNRQSTELKLNFKQKEAYVKSLKCNISKQERNIAKSKEEVTEIKPKIDNFLTKVDETIESATLICSNKNLNFKRLEFEIVQINKEMNVLINERNKITDALLGKHKN